MIRPHSASVKCPRDGRLGAAYVDAIGEQEDDEHAGLAAAMLSYTWGYSLYEVVSALTEHCRRRTLDQKSFYVWMCCFCVNQHRVQEMLQQNRNVPFEEFRAIFESRVTQIGHILVLMTPLHKPINLTRIWW